MIEQMSEIPNTPIDTTKRQLIDHILFTQALVGKNGSPKVEPAAGYVEHTIHERINAALPKSKQTSNHVPFSVEITV